MLCRLRDVYEKNWPEIRSAFNGSLPDFILARRPGPLNNSVPVFCYHAVDAELFEADLQYLCRNRYRTLIADDLLARLAAAADGCESAVVLTFDDCPLNFSRVVFPLLRKYNCRAVAFIAPYFHDHADEVGDAADRPCTWDELAVIHKSGLVDFQSHTFEHRYLPRWPEPVPVCGVQAEFHGVAADTRNTIEDDLRLARSTIEGRLGKSVRHLAFPRYDGTQEAVSIGKKLGYRGFWWGLLDGRAGNYPGDSPERIVRVSGEFLQRLPGEGRIKLINILQARYAGVLRRIVSGLGRHPG